MIGSLSEEENIMREVFLADFEVFRCHSWPKVNNLLTLLYNNPIYYLTSIKIFGFAPVLPSLLIL